MLDPEADEHCQLKVLHQGHRGLGEDCPPTMGSTQPEQLVQRDQACTVVDSGQKVVPPPAASTQGEECKNMEAWGAGIFQEAGGEAKGTDCVDEGRKGTERLPSCSSASFIIPKLRLERAFSADGLSSPPETDEDDEEEDSDENCLRHSNGKRCSMVEASPCKKHQGGLSVQGSLRRRTHSEGSLLQEARSPCFASDNAIHCMETAGGHKGGWTLPSPKTLKKELAKNGGSMHQLYMLFSGRKVSLLHAKSHPTLLACCCHLCVGKLEKFKKKI